MSDEYGSHLPVLKALSSLLPMRRVLEFGAGRHSTPFFLGLPGLDRLISVELDDEWRERVAATHNNPVLTMTTKPPPPSLFDLVFIDDGRVAPEREVTIRWVLGQDFPPTVIHDAEVGAYRELIEAAPNHVMFRDETPWTALVWR